MAGCAGAPGAKSSGLRSTYPTRKDSSSGCSLRMHGGSRPECHQSNRCTATTGPLGRPAPERTLLGITGVYDKSGLVFQGLAFESPQLVDNPWDEPWDTLCSDYE